MREKKRKGGKSLLEQSKNYLFWIFKVVSQYYSNKFYVVIAMKF